MNTYSKSWLMAAALALAALMLTIVVYRPARAAGPWYVAPGGNDANSCSTTGAPCATINGAIGKASSGDTIKVATGTYTASTGSEVVLIDKSITLSGGWDVAFITQSGSSTSDGGGARRGITVNSSITVTVDRFVVQNGYSYFGGGISNAGTLTLNNSTVSGNTSPVNGGGGIYNEYAGTLTLNNSTVSGNTAPSLGNGGGIYNVGTVTLTSSAIIGNSAGDSCCSGGGGGGGISNSGTLALNYSIVSNNTILGSFHGSGIYNPSGFLTLNNSTINGLDFSHLKG